jgi:hypothetical protein
VNPDTGEDLFFLDATGWSGTWASGDTLVFELYESAQSVWIKEVVPAATDQEPHNLCVIGFYLE